MVHSFDLPYSPDGSARRIHLYLPDEYEHTDERYPVLYMFDGHNIFFDHYATYGKSWGLKTFLDAWPKRLIVVGVEPTIERLSEYSPYDFTSRRFGSIRGTGDVTLQWLIHEVKPHIDRHYRTWWHREATAVAGSSMGGLMALYALLRYNDYFSKAAAISPSVGFNMPAMEAEIERNEYHADTRLFVSYGTREQSPHFQSLYTKNVTAVARTLADKGFRTQLHRHERGTHCEACWEEEVPLWMPFLWL